jgi:hypothetical protein
MDLWVRVKQQVWSWPSDHVGVWGGCASCVCVLLAQVVSLGPLGVLGRNGRPPAVRARRPSALVCPNERTFLGRNGWYCLEDELAEWWDLAGWRGLQTPAVCEHFNNTFYAYGGLTDPNWGPNEALLKNLPTDLDTAHKLNYRIVWMEDRADQILGDRSATFQDAHTLLSVVTASVPCDVPTEPHLTASIQEPSTFPPLDNGLPNRPLSRKSRPKRSPRSPRKCTKCTVGSDWRTVTKSRCWIMRRRWGP